jgi:hypothetical protein
MLGRLAVGVGHHPTKHRNRLSSDRLASSKRWWAFIRPFRGCSPGERRQSRYTWTRPAARVEENLARLRPPRGFGWRYARQESRIPRHSCAGVPVARPHNHRRSFRSHATRLGVIPEGTDEPLQPSTTDCRHRYRPTDKAKGLPPPVLAYYYYRLFIDMASR